MRIELVRRGAIGWPAFRFTAEDITDWRQLCQWWADVGSGGGLTLPFSGVPITKDRIPIVINADLDERGRFLECALGEMTP